MKKILLFAGTSEGRRLSERMEQEKIPACACVATEYGETLLPEGEFVRKMAGRLTEAEMEALMRREEFSQVVDATHPYAAVVSENIRAACEACGLPYLRLLRAEEAADPDCIPVDSVEAAVRFLEETEGNVLVTTGSKELSKYTALTGYRERLFARVLSTEEAVAECRRLGFEGRNLIAMQGPFSEELNIALLKQVQAKYMVTKESGKAGGFPEKLRAAKAAGAKVILVRRPKKESGYSLEEVEGILGISADACRKETETAPAEDHPPVLTIAGTGMGGPGSLTGEAESAFREADVIFGAGRLLESLSYFGKPMEKAYRADAIKACAKAHPEWKRLAVGMSGDVGFYSGAKKLLEQLPDWKIRLIPGISSPVSFCAKLGIPWEDVKLLSLHGRAANLPAAVREHFRVFTLAGGTECSAADICRTLLEFGLSHVRVTVGQELSYPEERIVSGSPAEIAAGDWKGLQVMLIENLEAEAFVVTHGLPDEAFLRGNAPMTKEEIREISLSKLRLTKRAVAYDVGAGTGSVAAEMARQAAEGMVYAVEKKEEALALLEENKRRLGVWNLVPVAGTAPEALRELRSPTHAFIGGSSGTLAEILDLLLEKNPGVRVVLNAVTLETAAEMTAWLKNHPVDDLDVAQVAVAKARSLGAYHLMTGANPVTIFSFTGKGD